MRVVATLLERRPALAAVRRALVAQGTKVVTSPTPARLSKLLSKHCIDSIVVSTATAKGTVLDALRREYSTIPLFLYTPVRSDDAELMLRVRHGLATVAVEGIDEPVLGRQIVRHGLESRRLSALLPLAGPLDLIDVLQQRAWEEIVREAPHGLTTTALAKRLRVTRETLSRRFAAGGAPSLKRAIDGVRLYAAGQLLGSPAYRLRDVVRLLHFSSVSLLQRTARRTLGVSARALAALSDEAWLTALRAEASLGDWV